MKLGIVAENYYPTLGGIQEHVHHLKSFLTKAGVKVMILTGQPAGVTETPWPHNTQDHVRRVGTSIQYGTAGTFTQATASPQALARLHRILREEQFDLLNIHGPCDLGLPTMATALYKGPKVLTLHSYFPERSWRGFVAPYYRWVLGRARSVIAVSDTVRDTMARYADFDADVIPNGVDVSYWEGGKVIPRYNDGMTNLLYVGRMERRNGLDILLDAFEIVAGERKDVRLIIAGDGPLRGEYDERVPSDLRNRVEFVGAVYAERPALYASADLMVIPARAVGFSILLLEALASGLPVVALPAAGIDRAGEHWSAALLSRDQTAGTLAEAILLAASRRDMDEVIERGRNMARKHDWSVVAPRILDVFRRSLTAG